MSNRLRLVVGALGIALVGGNIVGWAGRSSAQSDVAEVKRQLGSAEARAKTAADQLSDAADQLSDVTKLAAGCGTILDELWEFATTMEDTFRDAGGSLAALGVASLSFQHGMDVIRADAPTFDDVRARCRNP